MTVRYWPPDRGRRDPQGAGTGHVDASQTVRNKQLLHMCVDLHADRAQHSQDPAMHESCATVQLRARSGAMPQRCQGARTVAVEAAVAAASACVPAKRPCSSATLSAAMTENSSSGLPSA